jgi:Flp pilus assembly pilin Flp
MIELRNRIWRDLKAFWRDEDGADTVEYILLVAVIALPLLAIVLIFRDRIWDWAQSQWTTIQGDAEDF